MIRVVSYGWLAVRRGARNGIAADDAGTAHRNAVAIPHTRNDIPFDPEILRLNVERMIGAVGRRVAGIMNHIVEDSKILMVDPDGRSLRRADTVSANVVDVISIESDVGRAAGRAQFYPIVSGVEYLATRDDDVPDIADENATTGRIVNPAISDQSVIPVR